MCDDNDADINNLEKVLEQYGYQKESETEVDPPLPDKNEHATECVDSVPPQTNKDGSPLVIGFEAKESNTPKYVCIFKLCMAFNVFTLVN